MLRPDPTVRAGELRQVHQVCSKHNAMSMFLTTVGVMDLFSTADDGDSAAYSRYHENTRMFWILRK